MKQLFIDIYDLKITGEIAMCLQAESCKTATRQGPSVMELEEDTLADSRDDKKDEML